MIRTILSVRIHLAMFCVAIVSACGNPAANNQNTVVEMPTPTPTPVTISIQELMGTGSIDINAKLDGGVFTVGTSDAKGGPCENFATGTVKAGWVFINGQMQGHLPLRKVIQLKPDTYNVSFVLWCKGPNDIWFDTWQTKIKVTAGKTVAASLADEPLAIGRGYRLSLTEIYTPSIRSSRFYWQIDLTNWDKETRESWNDFLGTPEWKSVYAAAQSPPLSRRLKIDLPADLGGPREIDADQVSALAEWFDLKLHKVLKVSDGPIPDFRYEDSSGSDDEVRAAVELSKQTQTFQNEKIAVVKKILRDFGEALKKAPEE